MKNELFIQLLDGNLGYNYIVKDNIVETMNGCVTFIGHPHNMGDDTDRQITFHLSNVAFHRQFKDKTPTNEKQDFVVHFKNGDIIEMLKGELSTSGDYLVCDTDFDATFIPLKNIKFHEIF